MSRAFALLVLPAAVSLCGCQQPTGFQNLVPVKGTVTLDGQPLSFGTISFAPSESGGQPAVGKIVDGKYTMLTTVDAPGVVAGTYKIRIESTEPLEEMPSDSSAVNNKPASLIPEKYNSIETSELEVEVVPGMADVNFDLES